MDTEWNASQPIYRQLRDQVVHMILDGILNEGDPLPSVRTVAAEYRVNPLTPRQNKRCRDRGSGFRKAEPQSICRRRRAIAGRGSAPSAR